MPDARKPGTVKLTVWVESELRDAAKKRAAERGETISEAVRKFLQRYAAQGKGK